MRPWQSRVVEEANLFNPAFCTALISKTCDEHNRKTKRPFPFALSFLVLPVVLHQATRSALPNSIVTSLLPWVQDHRDQLVDFSKRVERLRPITQETLLFGLQHDVLTMTDDGNLRLGKKYKSATEKRTELFTDEARECIDRAGFIGRWFAAAGTTATIFAAWSVAP